MTMMYSAGSIHSRLTKAVEQAFTDSRTGKITSIVSVLPPRDIYLFDFVGDYLLKEGVEWEGETVYVKDTEGYFFFAWDEDGKIETIVFHWED